MTGLVWFQPPQQPWQWRSLLLPQGPQSALECRTYMDQGRYSKFFWLSQVGCGRGDLTCTRGGLRKNDRLIVHSTAPPFFRAQFRNAPDFWAHSGHTIVALGIVRLGSCMHTRAYSIARTRDLPSSRWSKRLLLRARRPVIAVRLSTVLRLKRLRRHHP